MSYIASIGAIGFKCFFAPDNKILSKWNFPAAVEWKHANPEHTIAECLLPTVRARHFFTVKFAAALDVVTDVMSEHPPEVPAQV